MWSFRARTVLVVTILILVVDTKRPSIKEGNMPQPRDYRPSKWVANSAMDVWYGNKSMIDVISREFSDIMFKLTARPVRSVLRSRSKRNTLKKYEAANRVSKVEINFIDSDNNTVHTIKLQPMKHIINNTVFKVLQPLLADHFDY